MAPMGGEDDGSTLRADTMVSSSTPKVIWREARTWVIDGQIVTASLYKEGQRVR
jgi:hypothetical protein